MDQPQDPSPEKKPFWPTQAGVSSSVPPPPAPSEPEPAATVEPGSIPGIPVSSEREPGDSEPKGATNRDDVREKLKPAVENAKAVAVTAATQAARMAEQGARKAWPVIEPWLKRAWLNLRVWVPQLANPDFRSRQVVYHASDVLSDAVWHVELAPLCWSTGRADNLVVKQIDVPVRSYENPLQIVLATTATLLVLFLLWWFFGLGGFVLWLVAALVGLGVLRLKSWPEHARIVYSAGTDVTEEMPTPELVAADGRLTVVAIDKRLAEATRKSIAAKRVAAAQARAQNSAAPTPQRGSVPLDARPLSAPAIDPTLAPARSPSGEPTPPVTPISNYKRDELPPLKLDE